VTSNRLRAMARKQIDLLFQPVHIPGLESLGPG
jgi:hypothetical protein